MTEFKDLTNANFLLFAASKYNNPSQISDKEFTTDLRKIRDIKKLITHYHLTGELKYRHILNHLIVLQNVFDLVSLNRMIYLKLKKEISEIKPFMIALGLEINPVHGVDGIDIDIDDFPLNEKVINILRSIKKDKS